MATTAYRILKSWNIYILSYVSVYSRQFFYLFCFTIYKMVDSMDIFNSLNISIGIVTGNPEMWKFVPDYFKLKKMCKHAVKELSYLLRYVPDQYKTQQV